MASIAQLENGLKRIDFYDGAGDRKSIRIGKMSMRDADKIKTKIEELNAANINGTLLATEIAAWLAERPAKFYDKLVKVDLVAPRSVVAKNVPTLEAFLMEYAANRTDVKGSTATVYKRWRMHLVKYFGASRSLEEINAGDAADWKRWLKTTQKLARNTIGRGCGIACQFFTDARKRRLITENPFDGLAEQNRGNPDRMYFISPADSELILEACDDLEFAAVFALSRFGGLRTPSEQHRLRWRDIDWERDRFTVHSSKTEHHDGKAKRVVPLFPELRPYLEALFDDYVVNTGNAPNPNEFVIVNHRGANLRTQMERIIERAKVTPWPKLFQNLRSTRQTELERKHPTYVVCAWLGNSEIVARKHYLQVTDEDFEKALGEKAQRSGASERGTASSGATPNVDFLEGNANPLNSGYIKMGGTRLEQTANSSKKTQVA